jgi:hypothetical protein
MMMRSKVHTEHPQILGNTVQNLVERAIWCPGFVHPCLRFMKHCCVFIPFPGPILHLWHAYEEQIRDMHLLLQ